MQQAVREVATRENAPITAELARQPHLPWSTLRQMGAMCLLEVMTPERYASAGLSLRHFSAKRS